MDWVRTAHGVSLKTTAGVTFVAQDQSAIDECRSALADASAAELLGVRIIAEITGSAVLALYAWRSEDGENVLEAARLDEAFQIEKWGRDAEAESRTAALKSDFDAALRFLKLSAAP